MMMYVCEYSILSQPERWTSVMLSSWSCFIVPCKTLHKNAVYKNLNKRMPAPSVASKRNQIDSRDSQNGSHYTFHMSLALRLFPDIVQGPWMALSFNSPNDLGPECLKNHLRTSLNY